MSYQSEWVSSKILQIINAGKGIEKREPTLLVGMSVGAATTEDSMEVPKTLKLELPNDPAIPLLGIYLEKAKTLFWKDSYTPTFIVAPFTVANTWMQCKCLSTDDG